MLTMPTADELRNFEFECDMCFFGLNSEVTQEPSTRKRTNASNGFSELPVGASLQDLSISPYREALHEFKSHDVYRWFDSNPSIINAAQLYLKKFGFKLKHKDYPLHKIRFFWFLSEPLSNYLDRKSGLMRSVIRKEEVNDGKKSALQIVKLINNGLIVESFESTEQLKRLLEKYISQSTLTNTTYTLNKETGDCPTRMLVRELGLSFSRLHGKRYSGVIKLITQAVDKQFSPSNVDNELARVKKLLALYRQDWKKVVSNFDGNDLSFPDFMEQVELHFQKHV